MEAMLPRGGGWTKRAKMLSVTALKKPRRNPRSLPKQMGRVTLADVAAACRVSRMTVSRVVRGIRGVNPATAARVEEAIHRLGYHPDPLLSALAAYRSDKARRVQAMGATGATAASLAFIDCDGTAYSRNLYEAALAEAGRLGYHLEFHPLPGEPKEQARLSRRLDYCGIRGILLGPAREERHVESFRMETFAAVSLSALSHSPALDSVSSDYFNDLYLAARTLREVGAARIGLCLRRELERRTGHQWLGAYLAFCADFRAAPRVRIVPEPLPGLAGWLEKNGIDGLLTVHPEARALRPRLRVILLREPVHREGEERGAFIRTPPEQLAQEGVGLLHQRLIRRQYGLPRWPRRISIRGEICGDF